MIIIKVWILSSGELCEGSSVVGVYVSEELARKAAHMQKHHFEPWEETHHNYWISGCDYLEIKSHELVHEVAS